MKDIERLLVTLITSEVIEDCDTANSRSISFDFIRNVAKKHGLMKDEYNSNQCILELMKKYEGIVYLQLDTFGSDDMFIDDDEEEMFSVGELSEEDGITLYVFDSDLHSDFECFNLCESEFYSNDELCRIEKYYERRDKLMSDIIRTMHSIETIMSANSLDEEHAQHLYFALADIMNQPKAA